MALRCAISAALLLLAALPAPAGEPDEASPRVLLRIDCPFRGRASLHNRAWLPLTVTVTYTGGDGPVFRGALDIDHGPDRERARVDLELPLGTTKRTTVLLWIPDDEFDLSARARVLDEAGRPAAQPAALDLAGLDFRRPDQRQAYGADRPLAVCEEEPALVFALRRAGIHGVSLAPGRLFRHWGAYAALSVLVLRGLDLSGLDRPRIQALRRWVASGGVLLLAPGAEPAFFRSRLVQSFFPVAWTRSRTAGRLALAGASVDGSFLVHDLEEDGRPWPADDLVRSRDHGFGRVLLFRTDLAALDRLPPEALAAGFPALAAPGPEAAPPLGDLFGILRSYEEEFAWADERADIDILGTRNEFLRRLFRSITSLPPVGLLALFFLLYIAVVGPVNYLVLRRRGRYGLLALSVPGLALVFILVVLFFGFLLKGGGVQAARMDFVRLPHRSGQGLRTSLLAFRTFREGEHSLSLGGDLYPLLSFDKKRLPRRMNQTGGFRLEKMNLRQWDRTVCISVAPADFGGGVALDARPPGPLRLRNRTGRALGAGLLRWSDYLAVVPPSAPGGTVRFTAEERKTMRSRTEWFENHPELADLLLLASESFFPLAYDEIPLLVLPVEGGTQPPEVNGAEADLALDRTLLLIRPLASGRPAPPGPDGAPRKDGR